MQATDNAIPAPRPDSGVTGATDGERAIHWRLSERQVILVLTALIAWAAFLYRPWHPAPFEPVDFSDTLPLILGHATFGERFASLCGRYVESYGRTMPVFCALVAWEWTAFGWNSLGWHLVAFVTMATNVLIAYLVLRRLDVTQAGALAGASLFVFGGAAAVLWIGIHYSEPLGVLLLLAAVAIATGYQRAVRWRARAIAVTLLLVIAGLTKETFVACVPFVLLVAAAYRGHGTWRLDLRDRRTRELIAISGIGLALLVALPAAYIRLNAPHESYAAQYSVARLNPQLGRLVGGMFLPSARGLWNPANLAYLGVVAAGVALALRRPPRRDRAFAIGTALTLPAAGTLMFLPWFYFSPYYAYPYLLGPAFLLGLALTELEKMPSHAWRRAAPLAYALCAGMVIFGSRTPHRESREATAIREAYRALADTLRAVTARAGTSRIVFAVDTANWYSPWWMNRLQRYSEIVNGDRLPPSEQMPCETALARTAAPPPGVAIVIRHADCAASWSRAASPAAATVVRRWRYLSLRPPRFTPDSMRIDIWTAERETPGPGVDGTR